MPKRKEKVPGARPPAFVTGGGGFDYEDEVAAFILAAMLANQPPFAETDGLIARIDWQQDGAGWSFGDLVLSCAGPERRRIGISCKSYRPLTQNGFGSEAKASLAAQWHRSSSNPFDPAHDLLAFVMNDLASTVEDAWNTLIKESLATDGATFAGRTLNNKLERALVSTLPPTNAIERAKVVRSLRLYPLDLKQRESRHTRQATEWCRHALIDGDRTAALALHDELRRLAKGRRPLRGSITPPDLARELSLKYRLKGWPQHDASWRVLDARSAEYRRAIDSAIGNRLCLPRFDLMGTIQQAGQSARILAIEGPSGSGKSSLVTRYAADFAHCLWFDASDLEQPTLSDLERKLGLHSPLLELIHQERSGHALLVIDRAERLSDIAVRHAITLANTALNAAIPWHIVLMGAPNMEVLSHAEVTGITVETIPVPLPDANDIRHATEALGLDLGSTPSESVIQPLRNLQTLNWLARASFATPPRSFTDIVKLIWESHVTCDVPGRTHVLKLLAERDADAIVGGVPSSQLTLDEARVADDLLQAGVLIRRDERFFFRHDLLGDWARLRTLIEAGDQASNVIKSKSANIRWGPAIRLYAQYLAGGSLAEVSRCSTLIASLQTADSLAYRLLLEGVCVSPNAGGVIQSLLPGFIEGKQASTFLSTFLAVATEPSQHARLLKKSHPIGAALRASHRVAIAELWPEVVKALAESAQSLAKAVPVALGEVVRIWLMDGCLTALEPFRETTIAAARCALSAAKELQARTEGGGYFGETEGWTQVYEAALLGAPWLPDEIGQWALEMSRRRPLPTWLTERVEQYNKKLKEERKHRLPAQPRRTLPSGSGFTPPRPRKRPPLADGPTTDVDEAFRNAVLDNKAITRLFATRPAIAHEVLLACCLQSAESPDPLAERMMLRGDRVGTEEMHNWHPPLYLRGPWVLLLRQHPETGIDAVLKLVEIATGEWERTCLPHPKDPEYARAKRYCTLSLALPAGQRTYTGGPDVFGWYRGYGNSGNIVPSALMALEFWLFAELDAGRSVDAWVERILQTGSSAPLGVLAALARKQPLLLAGSLAPLISSWQLLQWDLQLTAAPDVDFAALMGLKFPETWIDREANRWKALSHRKVRLDQIIVSFLAIGNPAIVTACASARSKWKQELENKDCPDPDSARRLIAMLDPANLSLDPNGVVQIRWPEALAQEYATESSESAAFINAYNIRKLLRQGLDQGGTLKDEVADKLWRMTSELPGIAAKDESSQEMLTASMCAIAAAVEYLAPTWLDRFPDRRQWCETVIVEALGRIDHRPTHASGMSLSEDQIESFIGSWAVGRMVQGDTRPLVRRALGEAMTSRDYIVTGKVLAAAVDNAKTMADELPRLFNLTWLWSALCMAKAGWGEDDTRQKIAEGWRRRLVKSAAAGTFPIKSLSWDNLRLHAARHVERKDRKRWAKHRSAFYENEEPPSLEVTPALPTDWYEYDQHGFHWSMLERVLEQCGTVVIRPSEAPHLAALVEFDERLTDLLEHRLRHPERRGESHRDIPHVFERLVMSRLCIRIAAQEDDNVAESLWRRIASYFPERDYWCEDFFSSWFLRPRAQPEQAALFHRRWQMLITVAASLPEWSRADKEASYRNSHAWGLLLGIRSGEKGLGIAPDEPYIAARIPDYTEWVKFGLDREYVPFCHLLQQPGAKPLRIPALSWIEKSLHGIYSSRDIQERASAASAVCVLVWHKDREAMLASPEARGAFITLVQELAKMGWPSIRELRTDVEAMLGGSQEVGTRRD